MGVTGCLGKELYYRYKVFDGTAKEKTQIGTSLNTSSSTAQSIAVHAWREPMPFEKESRFLEFVPCSRSADEDILLSALPKSSGTRKTATRKTVCVLAKIQDPPHRRNARRGRRLSVQLVGESDEFHGQRKIRGLLGLTPLDKSHAQLGNREWERMLWWKEERGAPD